MNTFIKHTTLLIAIVFTFNAKTVNMLKCLLVVWLHIENWNTAISTKNHVHSKHSKVLLETKSYCKNNLCPIWWHVSTYGFQGSQPVSFACNQFSPRLLCPCSPPIIPCSDSIYVFPLLPLTLSLIFTVPLSLAHATTLPYIAIQVRVTSLFYSV